MGASDQSGSGRFCFSSALNQACYGVGGTRSLRNPVVHTIEIEIGVFADLRWIVISNLFNKTSIAASTAVSDDNFEERVIGCAFSAETNGDHGSGDYKKRFVKLSELLSGRREASKATEPGGSRHHLLQLAHVLHHLPHLTESLKKIIHFGYRRTAAARDPLTTTGI